jgi:predicted lysophospholipase L1 biosynthesis ABC-type transport system permease subunit
MVATLAGQAPVWPAVDMDPADLDRLPVTSVVVDTDGSDAARERARTLLETALPQGRLPSTVAENESDFARQLVQWQRLADVVMLASLPIAGCGLAVAVVGGLTERKRPFSMLRLAGVPLAVLRRVVLLESVVPLVVVAAVAIGTGFLAAHLFISAQMEYRLEPPGSGFYLLVAAGLALSLAIVASAMPLLRRITGPETARNE